MVLTPRIECASTLRALASAFHVLGDGQHMLALSAKHCAIISLFKGPNSRLVRLACIVTADARVEFLAAEMFDGDDVKRGVPMGALR